MQTSLLNQTLESIFWCLQLFARQCAYWWENSLHAWRSQSRFEVTRINKKYHAPDRCPRLRFTLWLTLVRPRTRSRRVWRKWQRSFLHVWWKRGAQICGKTWHRSNLQSSLSCRRRLRIFWSATASYAVQCAKLLWRVWQFWRYDVNRRYAHVQFLNFEADGQA